MTGVVIHLVAAARPNFMKIAPLYHELNKQDWAAPVIVHTGQHYDVNMSDAFFTDLRLPEPGIHLGVGSGTHAEQTGKVMMAYEKVVMTKRPDMVVVVGDVNSTVACTLAASKIFYDSGRRPIVAHLEAGLRSFDRTMPEEINRLATDALADVLWTPSPDADENLAREGISRNKIVRVGNIMIDSLEMMRDKIESQKVYKELGLERGDYGVVTLHRPSNVDDPEILKALCETLARIAEKINLVFPVHPRTRKNMEKAGLMSAMTDNKKLYFLEPVNYIRFMNLVFNCRLVITDSGGIQEETTYLGIPCLTMRPNTERPITVTHGTNLLCRLDEVWSRIGETLAKKEIKPCIIENWDGKTAGRVVRSIKKMVLKPA
ncbi:MAG: UDP-N-acetylglucosamine 2-epimerase (non-hydrolyzing) [bacterium]|nr:MAG: UDP-N-acetylglucosamine 2-epimerase (non-hydrolyzing) [bacterium]